MRAIFSLALAGLVMSAALLVPALPSVAAEVPGPVRIVPASPESSVRLEASFPNDPDVCPARQPGKIHAAYPGVIEIGIRADGLVYVVTELPLTTYLEGIAEVPRDWPMESLKAQVVAARSYAMANLEPTGALARELNFDLCSTAACQVYGGLVVSQGAWGDRWLDAVEQTLGEVLVHENKPVTAFYFSTSNGRTYSNSDIFSGEALPYLVPVEESDDSESPLSQWSVRMSLADLTEVLRLAGAWEGGQIETIGKGGDIIGVTGGGRVAEFGVKSFRGYLNTQAPCLVPQRFPTPRADGRSLPQVLPSIWFDLAQEGGDVVMNGRGWGHGVGMVQWGAKGKADRGLTYDEILSSYYGGIKPSAGLIEPGDLRIGLAVGLEEVTLEIRGDAQVVGAELPDGPVRFRGGTSLVIEKGEPIANRLTLAEVSSLGNSSAEVPASFGFVLSGSANVGVSYSRPDGKRGKSALLPRNEGPGSYDWDTSELFGGSYQVSVVADNGVDEVISDSFEVVVYGPPAPSPTPSPSAPPPLASAPVGTILLRGLGVLAFLVVASGGVALWSRRNSRP